jgi:hypothetical protein
VENPKAHGLGFLHPPKEGFDDRADAPVWVIEAWDWILRGALGLPRNDFSDSPGNRPIYLGVGSTNHSPTMIQHDNATSIMVQAATLDGEAERLKIDMIDLMKLDVEGHDGHVSMANSKSPLKTSLPLPSITLLLHVTPRRFRPIQ